MPLGIREQLKYLMLTLMILGISISITQFYVFGELTSSDKQEIKSILDDSVRQFVDRLLGSDTKSSVIVGTLDDPFFDYGMRINSTQMYPGQELAHENAQFASQIPDIRHIEYHASEDAFNSSITVRWENRSSDLLPASDLGPTFQMYISQIPSQIVHVVKVFRDDNTGVWDKAVFSSSGVTPETTRLTPLQHVSNFSGVHSSYNDSFKIIDLNLPLRQLGIEGMYSVSYRAEELAYPNSTMIYTEDNVSGILIPPPQYTFSAPKSLDLKPGEETFVKIGVNSPVPLDSQIRLSSQFNPNLDTTLMNSSLKIPKQGLGMFTLRLKVPPDASRSNFVLPINANVSFPNANTEMPLKSLQFNSSLPVTITPNEPASLSIPPEVLATIYTIVISTIIGWSIPNIASYISGRRRRRNFLAYIITIDEKYDTQKDDTNILKQWLTEYERKMQYALGSGKISESQYDLLKKKIDYYSGGNVNPKEQ